MPHPIPQSSPGRAVLFGGTAVVTLLGGLYLSMHFMKRREEKRRTNPFHEQVVAHVAARHEPGDALPILNSRPSNIPPAFPGKDHHSGHATTGSFKDTPEYAELGPAARNMVPPPQRGRSDGSGLAYTKSPNYAQNYGKTIRPDKTREE